MDFGSSVNQPNLKARAVTYIRSTAQGQGRRTKRQPTVFDLLVVRRSVVSSLWDVPFASNIHYL
jgi:hypothetical protein